MNDINELIKKAKKGNKTAEHQLHKDFYEIYLSFLKKYEILGASPDNELFNILFEQTLDDSNNISIMKEKFNQVVKMFLNNQYLAQFQKNESTVLARYFNGFLTSELTIDAFLIKLKALDDFEEVTGYEISFATLMDTFNKTSKLDEYLEQCIKTRDNVILKKIVMGFTTKVEKDFLEVYCLRHDLSLEEETKDENECYYSDDSIKMYLQEIGEIPLLTKEEEYDLGMRAMKGDKVAIDSLVTHNLRFVVAVSKHYYNKGLPFLDIIQDGNCGLLKAATKFDPTKGFRFTTYAFNWINRFIVRGITNKSDIIRKPVGVSLVLNKIALFSDKYVEQNNRQPSVKEIATEFDMSIEAAQSLVEIVQTVNKVVSLNIFINDGETGELQDLIADTTGSLENDLFDTEEKEEIVSFLNNSKLTEREKDIINKRFGLSNEVPMNTVQIAKIYGITRERIRQIEQSALKKLRKDPYINNLYIYISNHDIKLSGMERANINEKEVAIVSQQKLLEKSKKDQRFKGLYERIPEEKREDFESVLALLPSEYLAILHQKFGEDFSENKVFACNNEISLCINKTILPLIKRTMKKKEQGEEPKKERPIAKEKSLYERFNGFEREKVDRVLDGLSKTELDLLHEKYGEDFVNNEINVSSDASARKKITNIISKSRRALRNQNSKKELLANPFLKDEKDVKRANKGDDPVNFYHEIMNVIELLDKEPFNLLPEEMPFEQKVIITLLTKEDEDEDKNTSSLIANYFHHSVDEMFDIARKGLLDYKNNAITQFATKIDNKQKTIMSNVSSSKKS